ncbi:hypothetical protein N7462_007054 [Penicillium macrosclerotiorum]|uniref:uncharacterized protein n=1 Tax=Penicillium macrosclerotiorum TaxID=303699 RepID=UPI0025495A38|nr:uncharacterized protein N7462_007054 [Penicillium macrosclerotiorum]KAJ5678810.1 hypothetical protein N7462_007054 [Penicillium macrosclerotiorum]
MDGRSLLARLPCPNDVTGLLTQTILPSPVVQWIVPACLRSKAHKDVVFVGQRRIQVKEAMAGGFLKDITEKADFDNCIIGAKAINMSTQIPWDGQFQPPGPLDSSESKPNTSDNLPSQILVLSLDMRELLFLFIPPSKPTEFITFRRPLPVDVSLSDRFGRHIAVDPRGLARSRAVAVGASTDYFGLILLKSPEDIRRQMVQGGFNPVRKEHFFKCTGVIQFMEFLHPEAADLHKIILLIITSDTDGTYANVYEWVENNFDRPNITEFKLQKQDRMPTMIVPLAKCSSFLLVSTSSMAVYSASGESRPTRYPLIAPDSSVKEAALWTQWARPTRNELYSENYDGLYLCREDGWVYYLEFGNDGELENQTSLGQLHCDVDSAFDALDMGHEGADFILAAGSMGDGGLFVQEARGRPECLQRFLNWAPVTDAVMVPAGNHSTFQGDVPRDRLFVCSASSSGGGALHELRYGIEAQIGFTVPLDDLSGIRDMWALGDDTGGTIFVIIADPVSTLVLYMNPDLEEGISALSEEHTGLGTSQTLAAGCTPNGALIQVTETTTHIFMPENTSFNTSVPHPPNTAIVAVTVDGPSSTVLTAARHNQEISLFLTRLVKDDEKIYLDVSPAIQLDKEPVCVSLETFGNSTFVFMGTGDGTIRIFHVEQQSIVHLVDIQILIERADDISRAVDSLAVIRQTYGGVLRAYLLCGLRSGILVPFQIDFNAASLIGLNQLLPNRIGTTSVRLQSQGTFAIVICDSELWRVSTNPDGVPNDCFLSRIWITDQSNPAYFPIAIHGFGLINSQGMGSEAAWGSLFCFADRELLICSLDQEAKMVPRRIGLPGTARKLAYSEQLHRLILSYDVVEIEDPENPYDTTTRSYLEFVDPDLQKALAHEERAGNKELARAARGEIISCIMDWIFNRDGKKYHLVVIGTTIPRIGDSNTLGRVILLSAIPDPSDPSKIKYTTKHIHEFEGPVRAIAPYHDGLIVGAGKSIFPLTSRGASTRWAPEGWRTFPSAVVAITVNEPLIYVTTSRHGFIVSEAVDDSLSMSMQPRGHDCELLEGLTHCVIPADPPRTFLSSRGGNIRVGRLASSSGDGLTSSMLFLSPEPAVVQLFESILRFVPGSTDDLLPKSPRERGAPIYGVALNGAVYRFSFLNTNELFLLSLVQEMCLKDESLYPSMSARQRRRKIVWHEPKKDNTQVDGDLLARLAWHGTDCLENIVAMLDQVMGGPTYDSMLRQLSVKVFGPSDNYARDIVGWLRELLHVKV